MLNHNYLPALGALQTASCKTQQRGNAFRFRFRRTAVANIDAVSALADLGATIKIWTGGKIYTCENRHWSTRSTSVVRAYTVVQVA